MSRRLRRSVLPEISGEATLEDLVDAGMIIAMAGVRMALKNRIILRALREHADYDEAWHVAAVRDEILALASEKAADARRIAAEQTAASRRKGKPLHQSDYRRGDTEALGRRVAALRALSVRLEEAAEGADDAVGIVRAAQESALEEITDARSTPSIPPLPHASPSRTPLPSPQDVSRQKDLLRTDLEALMRARAERARDGQD